MKEQTAAEKLEMLEAALEHFFDTDTDTLLREYQSYLDKKREAENAPPPEPVDRKTALAYFDIIPERCRNDESLEMKREMLGVLSEDDFHALGEEQSAAHPELGKEIRSMVEFCIKFKRLL
jgi:hypothetical protein